MAPPSPPYPAPFGRYELLAPLGKGGMATLDLARERGASALLVVKRVLPELAGEREFVQMLVREAKVASLLSHPGIVRMVDLGFEEDQVFLAMEYVPGWSLLDVAKAGGRRVPPGIAARIGRAVAEALAHAHDGLDLSGRPLRLVHRDVTPANVMVTPAGAVKLIDFGIAKAAGELSLTRPGVLKGKFRFLSPEQIQQQPLDGRSDLFSLGVSLYEVTTGHPAFGGDSPAQTFHDIVERAPPAPRELVPGYPACLEAVILRAMEKQAAARYPDAASMAAALSDAVRQIRETSDVGEYVRFLAQQAPALLPPPFETDAFPEPTALMSELPTRVDLQQPVATAVLVAPPAVEAAEEPQPTIVTPTLPGSSGHASEPAWAGSALEDQATAIRLPARGRPRWVAVAGLVGLGLGTIGLTMAVLKLLVAR